MPDGSSPIPTDAEALLARQKAAFLRDGAPDLATRRADLKALKSAILARRTELAAAANSDFGNRPSEETMLLDLAPTTRLIDHLSGHLRRWMRPDRRDPGMLMRPGSARVRYQPLGVVGIVAPWNYPFALSLTPLATALAAGNRAMLKPSELAPATAELLQSMLAETFDTEKVATVTGDAGVAAAFAALPFDHLLFTGSTGIGRKVASAAAGNLTPVTLELGGKSPTILTEDCDLEKAAGDIAFGKTANGGQICISPDYALVPEDRVTDFAQAFTAAVRKSFPAGLSDPGLTSIISDRHHARLLHLVEDARAKGAEILRTLATGSNEAHPRAMSPVIILGATDEMEVMREEIFGPILPVIPYRDLDAAIDSVNDRPRPLALYVYGRDRAAIDRVLDRTISGGVTVNGTMLHFAVDSLPFGGVGDSGMGAYHGIEGFRRFSHARGIYRTGRWSAARLLRPPHGRFNRLVTRILMR